MLGKPNPVAVHIVLETSCLFTEAADKLVREELSAFILSTLENKEFNVTWHLPDIARAERKHQMTLRAQRFIPQLAKVENLLGYSFGISKETLDERVEAAIAREIQRHKLQVRKLDVSKVDWEDLISRSVQRLPPFDPGEKEKGFRDAVVVETFSQLIENLPKSPQSCRIILMSGDQLLIEAARKKTGARTNVAFTGDQEEVTTMLNALASALTQEMIERILPVASERFFSSENEASIYSREAIGQRIRNEFSNNLKSLPSGFTDSTVKRILIRAPAFLGKKGQRLTFSSRITYEVEATKTVWRPPPASPGGLGLLANIAPAGNPTFASVGTVTPSSAGLLGGLFGSSGTTGTLGSSSASGTTGPTGIAAGGGSYNLGTQLSPTGPTTSVGMFGSSPHLSNPSSPPHIREEIRRAGLHVFEVIWSATLTSGGAITKPKVEKIEHKSTIWEEEP